MSIFNKKIEEKQEAQAANLANSIGKGTTMKGDIEAYGNIRIEGKLIGNLKCKSKVVLGKGSYVEGNIIAQNAEVEGEVKGKIEITDILALHSTAVIVGEMFAGKVITEAGAKISGKIEIGGATAGKNQILSSASKQVNGRKIEATV